MGHQSKPHLFRKPKSLTILADAVAIPTIACGRFLLPPAAKRDHNQWLRHEDDVGAAAVMMLALLRIL